MNASDGLVLPWGMPHLKAKIDNELIEPKFTWFIRQDVRHHDIKVPTGFRFKIPEKYFDGLSHEVILWIPTENRPLGKAKKFRFKIKNLFIDLATREAIAGWLQLVQDPGPFDLDIYINNRTIGSIRADSIREDAEREYGY